MDLMSEDNEVRPSSYTNPPPFYSYAGHLYMVRHSTLKRMEITYLSVIWDNPSQVMCYLVETVGTIPSENQPHQVQPEKHLKEKKIQTPKYS